MAKLIIEGVWYYCKWCGLEIVRTNGLRCKKCLKQRLPSAKKINQILSKEAFTKL